MAADEQPDQSVPLLAPLNIELEPVGSSSETAETQCFATIESGPKRPWIPAVLLGLVLAALFAGQAVLFDTDEQAADIDEPPPASTTAPPATAQPTTTTTIDPSLPLLGPAVNDTHAAHQQGILPLFPGSGPSLLALRRGAEVHVIDSQTGHKRVANLRNTNEPVLGATLGITEDRLLVVDGGTVRSLAIYEGTDFDVSGKALAIDTTDGATVVLRSERFDGGEGLEIQRSLSPVYYPSGWGLSPPRESELIAVHTRVLLRNQGELFDPRNSRVAQIGEGRLVGAGPAHVLIENCDGTDCGLTRIGDDGSVDAIDRTLPDIGDSPYRLSPDGMWAAVASPKGVWIQSLGTEPVTHLIGSFGTSQEALYALDTALPFSFTPDSRYVAAITDESLSILTLDKSNGETRKIPFSSPDNPYAELVIATRPQR